MTDLFKTSMMFPRMAFKVAASMSAAVMDMQLRMLRQQGELLRHMHSDRRTDDPHVPPTVAKTKKRKSGKRASPCRGPDLMDHYGHRARDVDVEHI